MIAVGNNYTVSNVKHPKREDGEDLTTFGVKVMDQHSRKLLYYTMFVEEALNIQDDMMITVTNIKAVKSNTFRGNPQTTVYCEVEIGAFKEKKYDRDKLPF